MRYINITALIIFLLWGCTTVNEPEDNTFYDIVNSNFLNFTDTIAYKTGSFFLVPGDSIVSSISGGQKINVLIDTVIHDSKVLATSIVSSLKENNLSAFESLISGNKQNMLQALDVKKINQTGRYNLEPSGTVEKVDSSYAGQIIISRPYMATDKAIFFITIKASVKSGKTNAYFLSEKNNNWEVLNKLEVERW